jgi:hypothetical protein
MIEELGKDLIICTGVICRGLIHQAHLFKDMGLASKSPPSFPQITPPIILHIVPKSPLKSSCERMEVQSNFLIYYIIYIKFIKKLSKKFFLALPALSRSGGS